MTHLHQSAHLDRERSQKNPENGPKKWQPVAGFPRVLLPLRRSEPMFADCKPLYFLVLRRTSAAAPANLRPHENGRLPFLRTLHDLTRAPWPTTRAETRDWSVHSSRHHARPVITDAPAPNRECRSELQR